MFIEKMQDMVKGCERKMEPINIIENLNGVWTIGVAIGSVVIYKLIPYLKTKIFTYKYYNLDTSFFLVEYELIGTLVAHIAAMIGAVTFGESTWSLLKVNEYFLVLSIFTLIYILGIGLIVKIKTEKGRKKYIINIFDGMFIYFMLSVQFFLVLTNQYNEKYDAIIYFIVFCFIILQVVVNINSEKTKSVKYIVKTQKKKYETLYEPIKRGKYYFIRITDKKRNEIKRIQLPEEKIEKIEHIIEKVEEMDKENKSQNK